MLRPCTTVFAFMVTVPCISGRAPPTAGRAIVPAGGDMPKNASKLAALTPPPINHCAWTWAAAWLAAELLPCNVTVTPAAVVLPLKTKIRCAALRPIAVVAEARLLKGPTAAEVFDWVPLPFVPRVVSTNQITGPLMVIVIVALALVAPGPGGTGVL